MAHLKHTNDTHMLKTMKVIGICGGAASGKTFIADLLFELFKGKAARLTQDDYYRDFGALSEAEKSLINFDHPDAIESSLLIEHLKALKLGKSILPPKYDMKTSRRSGFSEPVHAKPFLILDGLFLLCIPGVNDLLNFRVFVDSDEKTRVARIIKRDVQERGKSIDFVQNELQKFILPMHAQFIEPFRDSVNVVIENHSESNMKSARESVTALLKEFRS